MGVAEDAAKSIKFEIPSVKSIEFDATFGEKTKHIEITWPTAAAGICHVAIDKYYNGQIVYQNGHWQPYLVTGTDLTGDECNRLGGED